MTPKYSPILWCPPKKSTKFHTQKIINFLQTPKNIEIQKFWTPKKWPQPTYARKYQNTPPHPPPRLGPRSTREGSKCQISFNYISLVNFKDFYTNVCVCSHKKILKKSDKIFVLRPGSCPRGWYLGGGGLVVPRGVIFFSNMYSKLSLCCLFYYR